MDRTTLPTQEQLGLILHRLLIDIRFACYTDELNAKELAEVTDLMELIPLQFINRHEGYLDIIVRGLRDLVAKYPWCTKYAEVLDMTPDEVAAVVIRENTFA